MDKKRLQKNVDSNTSDMIRSFKKLIIMTASFAFLLILIQGGIDYVKADTPTSIPVKVNYIDETVMVPSASCASTKFYISTDNCKTWELIEDSKSITNTIDISGLLSSKEVTIYFKGNKDTQPTPVVLQAEDNTLKPVYKVIKGSGDSYKGIIEFSAGNRKVQYRKGTNGVWLEAANSMDTSMYEIKGATLYFRMAPSSSLSNPSNPDLRAGKIVSVKIQKRPTAPSVRFDGSKLCLTGLKSGLTQYRVGDATNWTTFNSATKASFINLTSLPGVSVTTNGNLPSITVEFRTPATDKKIASAAKVIEIPEQPRLEPSKVNLVFTTTATLSVTDTDQKRAYEYSVVPEPDTLFDFSKARWTTFTSKKHVVIKNVAIGRKVLVRMKSTTDTVTKQIIPASTYASYTVKPIQSN